MGPPGVPVVGAGWPTGPCCCIMGVVVVVDGVVVEVEEG